MNVILGLMLVLINLYVLYYDSDKGIELFIILTLISPITIIFGLSISYDYLFLPIIVLWSIKKYGINFRKAALPTVLLFFYLGWIVLMTIITTFFDDLASVNFMVIMGTFKYIFLFGFLSKERVVKEKFNTIIRIVVGVNCLAVIVEYLLIQKYSAVEVVKLWMRLFATSGSLGSLNYFLKYEYIGRLQGTFSSSAFLATLSVLGIGIFVNEYANTKSWKSVLSLMGCIVTGIASSSKRFFLGAIAILVLYWVVRLFSSNGGFVKRKKMSYKGPLILFALIGLIFFLYQTWSESLNIAYNLKYLTDFSIQRVFETRFGENGVVNSMIPVIKRNLLTGVGDVAYEGINVTDSMLYVILYKSGMIGSGMFIAFFVCLLVNLLRRKSMNMILVFAVVCLEFIISTQFFSPMGIFFASYLAYPMIPNEDLHFDVGHNLERERKIS